ncbi:leucine-rich repeat-containing protein 74B-like [Elysia marginata]|uniref:Leucine-rich repeat-containing protein 74B-like n=1 Tax=Elysia marginata TaxID=1093978 RepID=A0AAV4FA17_9GAST|nr:leucine-rich repeat-containing protein 74B-like [Elysia marginata]
MEDLDLSWNGIAYEGSLALGSALKQNSTLKRLNLTNNRINWDCAPHLSPALAMNSCLECLELGQNPISMEGCEEILSGAAKPRCNLKFLGLSGIPINTKIVMLAAEIAKMRPFTLDHGGILNTRDVIGIQRARREDPLSLLIRYLSAMGIRVMDLFRMMDKDNSLHVSRQKFIQGLKRVRVPLDEEDIMVVAKRLQSNKHGFISYQELAANVRNRIREDRLEDKRQEILIKKKKEERRRILQSDRPLNAPSYLPTLYHMYGQFEHATSATPGTGSRVMSRASDRLFSPSVIGTFSRHGSAFSLLPRIASGEVRFRKIGGTGGKMSASASDSPLGLNVQASTSSPAASQRSSAKGDIRGTRHESVSKPRNDLLNFPHSQGKNSALPSIGRSRWRESAKDLVALKAHKLI